jgi:hypothetical protein
MPPTKKQLSVIASELRERTEKKEFQIMLATLPEWAEKIGCRTEDVVAMVGWLVENQSPLLTSFSLDMHLVDAVVQCRLQREGSYDRDEWVGGRTPNKN